MKNRVFTLTAAQIDYLGQFRQRHTYHSRTQVVYSGQIPMAAYVLLEGRIDLKNARDKLVKHCEPPTLIGFQEICKNEPFKYTAEIQPGSIVLILDRSAACEIINDMSVNTENHQLLDIVS